MVVKGGLLESAKALCPIVRCSLAKNLGGKDKQMSYSLNSLKGGYIGDYIGTTIGVIKGDTRSLDYGSYVFSLVGSMKG